MHLFESGLVNPIGFLLQDVFEKVKADIRLMREELNNIERSKQPKERSLAQLRSSLEAMQSTKEGLESELHQELMTQLSVTDQLEVDRLNDDIRRLTQENKDAFIQRMRLEADKNKLENLLTNNLIRRRDELHQALQEISVEDRNRKLDHCRSELGTVERRLDDVSDALKDVEKKVSDLSRKQKEAQSDLEKLRFKEKDIDERLAESAKDFDKMASKQTALQQKITECTEKIRDLGSLPSDSFDKYQSMATKQLFKQLEKANSELKKYRLDFFFVRLLWPLTLLSFYLIAMLTKKLWTNSFLFLKKKPSCWNEKKTWIVVTTRLKN